MRPGRSISTTSVQEARRVLGLRLRELRRDSNLTGRQLAERLAWPPSKISKLETGRQTPTDDDIRAWTAASGAPEATDDLLVSLHALELRHAEWRRQLQTGLRHGQTELADLDARTKLFRVFEATVVPGLLQTAEYARARFEEGIALHGLPNDVDEAVRLRTQRQEILYRRDKQFHFVLTEAALRYRLCPADVMLAQLDRLVSLSALRNVRLGVIPFEQPYEVSPYHGFWLLDRDRVMVETYSAELNLGQQHEIELYSRIFDRLAATAKYGGEARAIIVRAIDDHSAMENGDGFP